MTEILKICLTNKSGFEMKSVFQIDVVKGKGIINDRYFSNNTDRDTQITLIESENIDFYNKFAAVNIPYVDFRRNIITKGINLNNLVGKEFLIGNVRIFGHRLCNPCKYLQDKLEQNNFVKNFLNKGGLRAEILTNGKISIKNKILTIS